MSLAAVAAATKTKVALNRVELKGKISRVGGLKYTPAGKPILEFVLAVSQRSFDKDSMGYIEVQVEGSQAEDLKQVIRIGKIVEATGHLWSRKFRDRQGNQVTETKVILETWKI